MKLYLASYKSCFTNYETAYSLVKAESTEQAYEKISDKIPTATDIEIEEPIE
tara:strand:- start:928 stop:1083 length:156 start_codon:yes stop_codon:yes gene_type:complete